MKLPQNLDSAFRAVVVPMAVALCLIFGYFTSAGPVYYMEQRLILRPSARVLERCLRPANWLALRSRPYFNYLQWWATKGMDVAIKEAMGANQSLHSTPR